MSEFRQEVITEGRGPHGWDERWLLHGPAGSVQFLLHISTTRGSASDRWMRSAELRAYDLGYHWPTPRYEGHSSMAKCEHLAQGYCYYDGSSLNADRILDVLLADGVEAVWTELRAYYDDLVGGSGGGLGELLGALGQAIEAAETEEQA